MPGGVSIATVPSTSPEEKARIEAEKQAKAEKDAAEKAEKEAQAKIEKEKKDEERAASLTGEDKNIFDSKFQEYKASFEEKEARAKALADVDAAISAREAAAKQAAEAAKAAEENAKKEQAKRAELEKNITEGWDKTDPNSQDNFEKAARIVANNTRMTQNTTYCGQLMLRSLAIASSQFGRVMLRRMVFLSEKNCLMS